MTVHDYIFSLFPNNMVRDITHSRHWIGFPYAFRIDDEFEPLEFGADTPKMVCQFARSIQREFIREGRISSAIHELGTFNR